MFISLHRSYFVIGAPTREGAPDARSWSRIASGESRRCPTAEKAVGFPFLCFACSNGGDPEWPSWGRGSTFRATYYKGTDGSQWIRSLMTDKAVPLNPLWPGLAANAALWMLVARVSIACVDLAVSGLRRRKGRCPWCGYDRAGLVVDAACPECGRKA